ncbi:LOW QUALITY PROTEIN: protein phosphatase 1 regulatory subunit 26 [Pteropus vampyrus]|uniref:LOW QUALITY PROTEIN: protein phosphatase 1 regulatory subunit 26 n=1 Tax=Pteropus vampyrus TaxID=132908 RepID=A0A6P6CXP7_PTEVA|nr:LOW QUALITY PROTEIN: protein phosphatase 1 regulatory subunit 26 [Pteropus vampyrus]
MFLVNAPPVLALQSRWDALGPPGTFRLPGCFSEPTESAGGAAVSAQVQMLIGSLQSARAARGASDARAPPRSQRAEAGRDARRATSPALAACGLAAGLSPRGDEEAGDFGPSVPDPDSDDSVDRDIEEAIQEYLKARSRATQLSAATDGDSQCKAELPQSSAPTAPCPPQLAPGPEGGPGSCTGASEDQGSASPLSVSSEDSFEQSIQAEIEQFLSKKRQHETPKRAVSADRNPEPSDNPARSASGSGREPAVKARRQNLTGVCKEFVFRKLPRLAKASAQPRGLRSQVTTETESLGSTKPAAPRPAATGRPAEAAPSKGGVRRSVGPGVRGKRIGGAAPVREASDSSSDDGIEEAIQLYQREKRREASGEPPQKTAPGQEQGPAPPAHGTSQSTKSALPETHRRAPSKKKPVASKALDLGLGGLDPDHPSRPPKETRAPAPPGNAASKSELADWSPCQADTSTELMCAEAILDISKTILPAPGDCSDRPLSASPLLSPPKVPSRSDGDSSSVDSDDSIEQEIRTFLALKAQSGSLLAGADACPQSTWSPLPSPGPSGQPGGLRAPTCKTPDLSLSCKRKCRGGSNIVRPSTPKKTRELVKEGALDADHSQGKASEVPGREGEARVQPLPCRTVALSEADAAPHARSDVSPGHGKAVEARSVDEKESSEDKSSSLDSDEDLDTAIKDLLRSKRRLRRRCRDPRAAGKKKVRFSTAETQLLAQPAGSRGDWRDSSPRLLKSCLSQPRWDSRGDPARKLSRVPCAQAERAKPGGVGPADAPPAFRSARRACEGPQLHGAAACPGPRSDDSSSVDSDDSIELEIRKFLAEKAKESVSGSETQAGGPPALGSVPRPGPLCRKVALPPGMCTRSQRGRGTPQPAVGPRAGPRAEQACLPAALARGQPASPRRTGGAVSARGSPAGARNLYPPADQSPRGSGPAAGDSTFGQLSSCAEGGTRAGSPTRAVPVTSHSRSTPAWGPGVDRGGGPQASLALPWGSFAHQSRLQSTWMLSSEGGDVTWRGGLGGEREKGPEEGQALCAPSLTTDPTKAVPFAGFSPLLSTQFFHFGKGVSWGSKPAGLFSPPLSLPLQGPSFSAFREAPAGHGPVFGSSHLLVKKEGGLWSSRKAPAALGLHARRNSGSEENILDLRYRRTVMEGEDDQEAWGSDASELSDTSVEEGGGPLAKGKVLPL